MFNTNEPHLLLSVGGVKAYHIQDGQQSSLTASGPQTLSMLMVPSDSPFHQTTTLPQNQALDQDYTLHLHLPPELELPLPASSQVYPQPPSSYLIPRWDLGSESGAFTRIEFPPVGTGPDHVSQEDLDTFETILAQCTAFLERATPPKLGRHLSAYNPADYAEGGKYAGHGQIVLVDEDDGSVVGELADGAQVYEHPGIRHGSKDPVEIEITSDGQRIEVRPVSEDYLAMSKMPQYQKSSLVQNAAAASRLIVTGSSYLGNKMNSGAENFVNKTKPNPKPMEFTPSTHERIRKINAFTHGAVDLSAKTVGQVSRVAQNVGASLARKGDQKPKETPDKPGLLNKSMIAFSTVLDGVAYSGKSLLTQGASAASTVVGHKYGDQAGTLAGHLAGGVKNVGLVYIDITGVSRRAVLKSVAKGMTVGRMKDGKQVVVGGGDGGEVSEADLKAAQAAQQQNSGQEFKQSGDSGHPPPPPYTKEHPGPKSDSSSDQQTGKYKY